MEKAMEHKTGKSTRSVVVLILCTVIMMAAGFANFKFPPILTDYLAYYGIEMGTMSIIMSVFQWICIIAMLPVGIFLGKYSPRVTGALGAVCVIAGNIIAIFAGNIGILVLSRVIEGLGYCILQVLTQSLVTTAFRDSKARGSAVGLLNTGMLFGQMIHYNLAPRVVLSSGLQGVYYYIIGTVAVLTILWLFLIKDEVNVTDHAEKKDKAEKRKKTLAVYKTRDLWLVALAFSIIRLAVVNVGSYIPAYLSEVRGLTMVQASGLLSISTGLGIAALILYGTVSDVLHTKRKVMIFSCLSAMVVFFLLMKLPIHLIIIFIILYGTVPRALTTITFSCYPEIFEDKSLIPVAHSMVHFIANIVTVIGTIVYGYVIQYMGYDAVWYLVIIFSLAAAVLWIFVRKVK
ncbi:MAG: MFS transporter [Eubacterium sp.]|nr:MFS transporter [Eubacterium sp.]